MATLIKLYGERNTNTNYLSQLIRLNLEAGELRGVVPPAVMRLQSRLPGEEWLRDLYFAMTYDRNLGWKHSWAEPAKRIARCTAFTDNDLVFVTTTKNPYSWLWSLFRRPYHQRGATKPDFMTFLTSPWLTVGRDRITHRLQSPIELWNIKNSSYLQLPADRTLHTTTERLIADAEGVIGEIATSFAIPRLAEGFTDYDSSTKDPAKDKRYYQDYYLNERWRDEIPAEAVAVINATVDQSLMARFGYERLT
jgi:hypothetical protein